MPARLRRSISTLALVALAGCASDTTSGARLSDGGAVDAGSGAPAGAVQGALQVQLLGGSVVFSWEPDEYLFHCLKISQDTGKAEDDFVYLCPPTKGQNSVTIGAKAGEAGVDFAWTGVSQFKAGLAAWELSGSQTIASQDMTATATGTLRIGPRSRFTRIHRACNPQ